MQAKEPRTGKMKRIDIALIASGLAMMGLSGFVALGFPATSHWVSFSGMGALQVLFGTFVMAIRQIPAVDEKLSETEAN